MNKPMGVLWAAVFGCCAANSPLWAGEKEPSTVSQDRVEIFCLVTGHCDPAMDWSEKKRRLVAGLLNGQQRIGDCVVEARKEGGRYLVIVQKQGGNGFSLGIAKREPFTFPVKYGEHRHDPAIGLPSPVGVLTLSGLVESGNWLTGYRQHAKTIKLYVWIGWAHIKTPQEIAELVRRQHRGEISQLWDVRRNEYRDDSFILRAETQYRGETQVCEAKGGAVSSGNLVGSTLREGD